MDLVIPIKNEEAESIIKEFIKTYVKNSGCRNVVLGLSGGVDSATVSLLCQQAIGRDHTLCLFLPEETTPTQDRKHCYELIKKFRLKCREIDITSTVKHIKDIVYKKPDKFALANIKARVRMIMLYTYANTTRSIVCGTSNKSELLTGYFTKYGDGGADIQPIGDLYKTQVYELAKHLKIPDTIIKKKPTAGLWQGQTDEKEIGLKYTTLDRILYGLEHNLKSDEIADILKIKKSEVERIRLMRVKTQHKRCTPLIPKLGVRTVGYDWRSPIQEG
ncbi:MAG: NAD+ synthase [Candidatus Thermoplasmatota archaeon]